VSEGATSEERLTGVFIDVEVNDSIRDDAELARKLAEVCPVDIFTAENGRVETVPGNLDECVLCELCLEAAPAGAVVVKKLYDGSELRR
jgi:NAD-dependent dihydropyrimidine dehydrogenase PreA subunit